MKTKSMARAERLEFADFLATLTPEQWDVPSLCGDWRVRDVAAHMISYDELTFRELGTRFVRGRFGLNRVNALGLTDYSGREPEELIALIRRHADPRGITAAFGAMPALLDVLIHHQDIRRPLGLPREIPAARLVRALRRAPFAPPIGAFVRSRGLKLVATDVDFTAGSGPEVRGPGEALLLGIAGRAAVLDELSGPGLPVLASRC